MKPLKDRLILGSPPILFALPEFLDLIPFRGLDYLMALKKFGNFFVPSTRLDVRLSCLFQAKYDKTNRAGQVQGVFGLGFGFRWKWGGLRI